MRKRTFALSAKPFLCLHFNHLWVRHSIKHEYVNGQICAMAGTSDSHAIIVANLVSQDRLQVEVFQRNEVGRWELYEVADAGIWELASIGFQAELAALCEDVVFEPIAETDSETDSISS